MSNLKKSAAALGRKGGRVKSEAKRRASAESLAKARAVKAARKARNNHA